MIDISTLRIGKITLVEKIDGKELVGFLERVGYSLFLGKPYVVLSMGVTSSMQQVMYVDCIRSVVQGGCDD